jgi:hypothetical protein
MGNGSGAQAQVAYTNSVLQGCYAHLNTSVDTKPGALNTDVVGTFCFDGNGNIVGTTGTPGLSGHLSNTKGTIQTLSDQTGTYSVTNSPGDGMGTFVTDCATREFSINHVDDTGIAQGFFFVLISRSPNCPGPVVIGGSAELQGPLN